MGKLQSDMSIRKFWILLSMLVAALSMTVSSPTDDDTLRQLASLTVTTFSFLAGFLIAAIAVVGYSTEVVARHGWQVAVHYRESFKTRLERYAAHFVLYLMSIIIVIFISYVKPPIPIFAWRISCFVCVFAFLMAFSLPYEIIMQHISIYDAVIEKAKKDAINNDADEFKA